MSAADGVTFRNLRCAFCPPDHPKPTLKLA
jgi:hypothetical protein